MYEILLQTWVFRRKLIEAGSDAIRRRIPQPITSKALESALILLLNFLVGLRASTLDVISEAARTTILRVRRERRFISVGSFVLGADDGGFSSGLRRINVWSLDRGHRTPWTPLHDRIDISGDDDATGAVRLIRNPLSAVDEGMEGNARAGFEVTWAISGSLSAGGGALRGRGHHAIVVGRKMAAAVVAVNRSTDYGDRSEYNE